VRGCFGCRSISTWIATVLMVWMGPGGSAAAHTPRLRFGSNTSYDSESTPRDKSNVGRSRTTIVSITSTTAQISVFGYGFTAPSGQLSFTDVTTGSPIAAPVTLDTSTLMATLSIPVAATTGANSLPDWTETGRLEWRWNP
jgi:hypothetical protein